MKKIQIFTFLILHLRDMFFRHEDSIRFRELKIEFIRMSSYYLIKNTLHEWQTVKIRPYAMQSLRDNCIHEKYF
jgi:hypothetical protein